MNAKSSSDDVQELWQMQPEHTPKFALDDVRQAAKVAARRLFWSNAIAWFGTPIVMSGFGFYIWHFKEAGVKVGSIGVILALLYALIQHHRWASPGSRLKDVGSTGCAVTLLQELERIAYYNNHSWRLWRGPLFASLVFFLVAISFDSWARAMAPWSWLLTGSMAVLYLGTALHRARAHARRIAPFNEGVEALRKLIEDRS
jgi:hypothetical protein